MSFIARERADTWEGDIGHASSGGAGGGSAGGSGGSNTGGSAAMDKNEALAILGIEEPFTRKEVTQAHRSLMGKFHPDKGGNTYLATKLNTARDILMDTIKQA